MPPETLLELGPWRGSNSIREKVSLAADELNGVDSAEWMVSPEDGRLVRRGGSTIQLDTLTGSPAREASGLLESAWGARAHQFIPLHIPSIADGYESAAWVVCDESGKEGTIAWLDRELASGAGGPNNLGRTDFDQTNVGHYRQDGSAGEVRMKVIPYVAESSGIDYGRLNSAAIRKHVAAGTRRAMETNRGLFFPGSQCAPYWWNRRRNITATTGTEKLRARPWGLDPAYWAPTSAASANVAVTAANWTGGNRWYECWRFVFADGSKGPPFRLSTTATTPARGGLVTLGTAGQYYLSRTISGIPLGPNDGPAGPCVAREGFRSLQATATDPLPDFSAMYGFMRIDDNTSTSAVDYFGADDNLTTVADDLNNQTWPPRAQVAVSIEGRTWMGGKLRFNPYALIIGPSGAGASRDLNLSDENTTGLYGTVFYHVRIVNTGTAATSFVYLKRTSGGATTQYSYAFNTYTTLQSLADAINETAFGGTANEWFCQIVPGVDGNLSSLYLRATSDCGDEDSATVNTAPADATTLNVRVYCPTFHFCAAFTETFLATLPTDETSIWASDGDPGGAGGHSVFRVRLGDRKSPGEGTGKFQMIEPCSAPGGVCGIVYYERKKYALVNTKGGGSLFNADYILRLLDPANGCVSHLSCFSGPGYSGCCDQAGPWVGDGNFGSALRPFKDHYDEFPAPGQLEGLLAYAIRTDAALAAAGSDTFTWMGVVGDKLRIRFRTAALGGAAYTNAGLDTWFGKGKYASGLSSLQREDASGSLRPFGNSCVNNSQKGGVHGVITDSTGRRTFAWQETNAGTADGRVDEVDMASAANDNGTAFVSDAYTACQMAAPFEEIEIHRTEAIHRKNGTGLTVRVYGDVDRGTVVSLLTLGTSGISVVKRQVFEHPMAARGNHQCCEMRISDDGTGTGAVEVRGVPTVVVTKPAATRY